MVPQEFYLVLSVLLFGIGTVGVLVRRNAIVVFMCIELMLNAGNLALITFARQFADPAGHIFVFLVMAVAAAEVSVGLAIIIAVFRAKGTINVDELNEMRG
ncbi:MAG: NADH-quinone oxidoreductase subunit NuoK [Deltaproteobacteria bacterium]|nr:NADH-quinone oxidoreductase subunit NuoK [Deltaproteobacteria bacterium]